MQVHQNSRRNFLSNIAVLSAGTAFKPAIKHLPSITEQEDLQQAWASFWIKYGGKKYYTFTDLQSKNNLTNTKGHQYKTGEIIYFAKENILAQPTWVYWKNNDSRPFDVIITLFEKATLNKISRLNRFEAGALYKVSKEYPNDDLLIAHCNNLKPKGKTIALLKNKISVKKNSHIQEVSYFKEQETLLNKKFINHY